MPTENYFLKQYNKGKAIFNYLQNNKILPNALDTWFVLEVGCAAGGILKHFADMGCRVKGIDLGEQYVEFGKTNYGLDLSVNKITKVSLDSPPDLIIYSDVLEHVLKPNEDLQAVYSNLSDKSLLYIGVPGVKNLLYSCDMDFLRYLQNAHVYHFTLTTLKNLLQKNGFELLFGDEVVRSVFRKSNSSVYNAGIVNDYDAVLQYLYRREKLRILRPFYPYEIKKLLKRMSNKILAPVGLYEPMRDLYRRLKNH